MILLLGKKGQLATSFASALRDREVVTAGSQTLDLQQVESIEKILSQLCPKAPSLIVNTMAYTAVDKAESEPQVANAINGEALSRIGAWARERNSAVLHFSTDYVFDGSGETPRTEDAPTAPLNAYGASKLLGEKALQESGARAAICRISWVYSPYGTNFVRTMLRLGETRNELRVIDDQIGSPMSAPDLATLLLETLVPALQNKNPDAEGLFHLASSPYASWHEFASEIFAQACAEGFIASAPTVAPTRTAEYPPTPARRPHNSRLADDKFYRTFGRRLPPWREGLNRTLRALYESH